MFLVLLLDVVLPLVDACRCSRNHIPYPNLVNLCLLLVNIKAIFGCSPEAYSITRAHIMLEPIVTDCQEPIARHLECSDLECFLGSLFLTLANVFPKLWGHFQGLMVNVLLVTGVESQGLNQVSPVLSFSMVPSESGNRQLTEPVWSDHWEQADKCDSELETEKEAAGHQAVKDALERASGPGAHRK